jgi:GH25 family lysozyme M1 (1,4-beta-N-acetylmuramidase)
MVWLDIEGSQYWSNSQSDNRNFFNGLVSELKRQGQTIGVYTSKSQWEPIMGNWDGGSHYPLWYAHYDGEKSFSDFTPFGGWSSPNIKQYKGDATLCSSGVDLNWYP